MPLRGLLIVPSKLPRELPRDRSRLLGKSHRLCQLWVIAWRFYFMDDTAVCHVPMTQFLMTRLRRDENCVHKVVECFWPFLGFMFVSAAKERARDHRLCRHSKKLCRRRFAVPHLWASQTCEGSRVCTTWKGSITEGCVQPEIIPSIGEESD